MSSQIFEGCMELEMRQEEIFIDSSGTGLVIVTDTVVT